jgi:hypothetical protein
MCSTDSPDPLQGYAAVGRAGLSPVARRAEVRAVGTRLVGAPLGRSSRVRRLDESGVI